MNGLESIKGIVRNVMMMLFVSILGSACYHDHHGHYHDVGPGPHGLDGEAYLSIDYTYQHPYSYWDDNPDLPYNPTIGVFYYTYPGIYEFEYFISPYDYWYGTYELWVNYGEPGRPHGEPGFDGADNYFTLFCDPDGFWMSLQGDYYKKGGNKQLTITQDLGSLKLKIVMQKANINDRPAQVPKLNSPSDVLSK